MKNVWLKKRKKAEIQKIVKESLAKFKKEQSKNA